MGFWSWLTGKPTSLEVSQDVVWMNPEAKLRGLRCEIQERLPETPLVLVVAHFPATLAQIREELAENNVVHATHERRLSSTEVLRLARQGSTPPPLLTLAQALVADDFPSPRVEGPEPLSVLVGERHFLRAHDDKIVGFARSLGRPCRVRFHLSLKDPLMRVFAGEGVAGVLKRLGMNESDHVQSPMIARRIRVAQRKFAKRVRDDQAADSPEKWLRLNVPSMAS